MAVSHVAIPETWRCQEVSVHLKHGGVRMSPGLKEPGARHVEENHALHHPGAQKAAVRASLRLSSACIRTIQIDHSSASPLGTGRPSVCSRQHALLEDARSNYQS
jgi:hypothetical protein